MVVPSAEADAPDQALLLRLEQKLDRGSRRGLIVDLPLRPVGLVDIEDVNDVLLQKPHAVLERPHHFDRVHERLGAGLPHRVGVLLLDRPFEVAHLCRAVQPGVIPVARERPAEQLLALPPAVHLSGVVIGDPVVHGVVQNLIRRVLHHVEFFRELVASQTENGDVHSRFSQPAFNHFAAPIDTNSSSKALPAGPAAVDGLLRAGRCCGGLGSGDPPRRTNPRAPSRVFDSLRASAAGTA